MSSLNPYSYDPKDMTFRRLGSTGLRISTFALGGWLTYGESVKGATVTDVIRTAFENGINTFDTAEGYAQGQSEVEMGRALKELKINRREIVLITKIFFGTGSKAPNGKGLSRKHIIEGVQDSLKRLDQEYVDVVLAHRADPTVPIEETIRAFNYVIDQGWAHYWGTSEWTAAEIEEAIHVAKELKLIGPSADQSHYSLLHRKTFEVDYAPLYSKYQYGTTIWSPLEGGLLSGKYNNGIPEGTRFTSGVAFYDGYKAQLKEKDSPLVAKLQGLAKIAERLGTTQSALSLAWAARNPNVSTVILGASKPEQIIENVKALQIISKLTPDVLEEIENLIQNKPEEPRKFRD